MRKIKCDNCGIIVPEKDISYVKRAIGIIDSKGLRETKKTEHICKECICFISEPKEKDIKRLRKLAMEINGEQK